MDGGSIQGEGEQTLTPVIEWVISNETSPQCCSYAYGWQRATWPVVAKFGNNGSNVGSSPSGCGSGESSSIAATYASSSMKPSQSSSNSRDRSSGSSSACDEL